MYNVDRNISSMMLQCNDDPEYHQKFVACLEERPELAVNPALVLVVAAQLEHEYIEANRGSLDAKSYEINLLTDYVKILMASAKENTYPEILQNITDVVHRFSVVIFGEIGRTKWSIILYERILDFMHRARELSVAAYDDGRRMKNAELKRHVEFLGNKSKVLLLGLITCERVRRYTCL